MLKKTNIKAIRDSLALLIIAAIVGTIVSFVAQLFIISAKNIYQFIFQNKNFILTLDIADISLNLIPLLICIPSSILVGLLMYYLKLPRWFGPADTIYAAHHRAGILDLKGGFGSTLASFISISGGASVGIYGPLVHFGATISSFIRRQSFIPKIPHDIIIGSGVAAAIAAGFGAPLAGIIFAHETVLRHFSMKAVAALAISSMAAHFSATTVGIVKPPLLLTAVSFEMSEILTSLVLIGPLAALTAILFMKLIIFLGTVPSRVNLKNWQAPIIAGLACGLCGMIFSEILGLGTDTLMSVITNQQNISYLVALLVGKLILTSICIGFGFFGGTFSPALFLGGVLGAIIFQLPTTSFNPDLMSVLAVSGMAAVSSSVIGAPITAIILVLELTGSYEYAIASTFPIVVCSFITSRVFGNSLFDKQLISRGVAITKGREQILLNEVLIKNYVDIKFTKVSKDASIKNTIELLLSKNTTEGYIVSNDNKYIGKVSLLNLTNKNETDLIKYIEKKPIVIDPNSSLIFVIKKLSNFVGESIPIVNQKTNEMIGIISENDVLKAYLQISEEINQVEKH
ncbi:chloride channel protein [Alphaproteobacteria bacterium]|nr:chloride channel protein [Alphaproteobacteria bacterium]